MSEVVVSQEFVFDWYEYEFGDGLFVEPVENGTTNSTVMNFLKEGDYWCQVSGNVITGLDGDFGIKTLNALNNKYKSDELYIAENMVNYERKSHTDYIMSLVGTENKSPCIGIKNTYGKILYNKNKYY